MILPKALDGLPAIEASISAGQLVDFPGATQGARRRQREDTEAAAAIGIVMSTRSLGPHVPVCRADPPFAFLIRDGATGAVLFMGRVADPR